MEIEQRVKRKANWIWRRLTSNFRILPDFIIAGFPRCGTTSLFNYITKHKCILSPLAKEPSFFSTDFAMGINWYKSYFPTVFEKKRIEDKSRVNVLTGEATPTYVLHPKAPNRIKEIIPEVKLIFLLRNPIDRAFSHYSSIKKRGLESLSFEDAITIEDNRLEGEYEKMLKENNYYSKEWHLHGYLSGGHYMQLLKNWFSIFERQKILVIKSEDMFKNPFVMTKKIYSFLNIPEINLDTYEQYNKLESISKLDNVVRKKLKEHFKPHNEDLYKFLGIDFDWY